MDLRPIRRDELAAFRLCLNTAFHHPLERGEIDAERGAAVLELDRTVAAFDGDEIVGTTAAFSLEVSVPGGRLPCAGITWVAVLPTHHRRGLLRGMMDTMLADAVARGEVLSALWSSEGPIYGRFGYAPAARSARFEIPVGPAVRVRGAVDAGELPEVRYRPLAGAADELAPAYERMRDLRPGMTARTAAWWQHYILADPPTHRAGATEKRLVVARDPGGEVAGYGIYRCRDGYPLPARIELLELVAPDPAGEIALWRFFTSLDLTSTIEAINRPPDDPIALLFDDVRAAKLVAQRESLWLAILDLERAMGERAWAVDADLVLAVTDERLPVNAGTWKLAARAAGGSRLKRTDAAPDLALDIRALAAGYFGSGSFAQMAHAGLIAELSPGAARTLDLAALLPFGPWTPDVF